MKSSALAIALVALLGLLAYSNPSLDDFGNYVRQNIVQESQRERNDPLGGFLGSIMGGIAGGLVTNQTVRTDYIFFSMYEVRFGKERLKALGILRNFILLEEPEMVRDRTSPK
jgi:tryptophanase